MQKSRRYSRMIIGAVLLTAFLLCAGMAVACEVELAELLDDIAFMCRALAVAIGCALWGCCLILSPSPGGCRAARVCWY